MFKSLHYAQLSWKNGGPYSTDFGKKRACLAGKFTGINAEENRPYKLADSPWFIKNTFQPKDKTVSIIGGGLAGTSCAYSFAQRGWQVHLYEREKELAQMTSGNPTGILSVQLGTHDNPHNRFYHSSYCYAIEQLKKLFPVKNNFVDWCGVLQLAFNEKKVSEQQLLIQKNTWPENWLRLVSKEQASEISGITCHTGGLFFPNAGWIQPSALCKTRCRHPNIHVHLSQSVEELIFAENSWDLLNEKNEMINRTSAVVIANAVDALKFSQTCYLPLRSMRGQVSFIPGNPESRKLKTVLSYEGYAIPEHNGLHSVGATFSPNDIALDLRELDHQSNLMLLQKNFPELYQALLNNSVGAQFIAPSSDENHNTASNSMAKGRVGIRCQTPDYLPIAGPVPQKDFFIGAYDAVRNGNPYQELPAGKYWPGLYVSLGHGSRGLTTTDFCAEIIASELNGEPLPIDAAVARAIHPARFLIRDLKRRLI